MASNGNGASYRVITCLKFEIPELGLLEYLPTRIVIHSQWITLQKAYGRAVNQNTFSRGLARLMGLRPAVWG